MNVVRKINQELTICGQITPEQLQNLADDGYKSILNLRFADEQNSWNNEQEKTELLGLHYVNFPIKIENLNHESAIEVFQIISELPKPLLIHCDNSKCSAVIVLLYISTKQGIEFNQAWQQAVNLGLL
ncbi:hypothetical protein H6G54_13850 [Anabaena cylindrica FACHB-243]|uniref:Beta-lactamase hydrolase-family protein n=1 Tax=Anabaena cylindrica (strain ATCC 27899 / PCC 7122) TaxID=272123 RepID=K9ZMM8_ANACC|nr:MULTISPECIES: sulfur transferase domain-containing protein [Anabaena]AFZ59575.1 Beta-lactamase hydrolase-family protein [Anabaena cylindrica PCC 7122]MBD2418760.1 hypothetical protein [Anabaena cylindrica FACHB-243]MBY5282435.1 hypothetical protein [Anabaena sp. CCAP 1446/1C]MBY5310831.1 hypothetical protein [Anabaena sp. CCAP 1446/1C]MCM2406324.1 sulfur transferase domain-containing protein [Anabaena sp. CCAP 1446/1C]